jgi:hypothetical protein
MSPLLSHLAGFCSFDKLLLLQANLTAMTTRIADLVRESERLGEEGDVDASQAAAQQAETLKVRALTDCTSRKAVSCSCLCSRGFDDQMLGIFLPLHLLATVPRL